MGDGSKIEWTDATWNPLIGCTRCSPGCDNCYAIGVVHRQMSPQHVGLTVKPEGERVDWTGEVRVVEHLMDQPLRWKRPRRIFVNSLSDLFHADVATHTIARIFAVMALAEQHTFQVLTKRPQRMAQMLADLTFWTLVDEHRGGPAGDFTTPLPNVWLGTSIESNAYAWRANHLRRTPATVRWISAEPLLGPLDYLDLSGIDWLVVGGESGPGARPMDPSWARDLRAMATCGPDPVAFHFKQWGSHDADGRRMPKHIAGRELDGRTWDEWPAGVSR